MPLGFWRFCVKIFLLEEEKGSGLNFEALSIMLTGGDEAGGDRMLPSRIFSPTPIQEPHLNE
jgi:hypothetical protein